MRLFFCVVGLVIVLILISAAHAQDPQPGPLVTEIINRFEKLSDTSINILDKLKLIKETSASFLKLAHPLGALLTKSFNIAAATQSPEYKAILRLHNEMNYKFDRLGERLTYSFDKYLAEAEVNQFRQAIMLRIGMLRTSMDIITDPTINKTENDITSFVQRCSGDFGLDYLVKKMKTALTTRCVLNTTASFVAVEMFWLDVQDKYKVTYWSLEKLHQKKRITDILLALPVNVSIFEVDNIKKKDIVYTSLEQALHGYHQYLKKYFPIQVPGCLLDQVFHSAQFDRVKVSYFTSSIQIELSRIMILTDVCGVFMFPNDTSLVDRLILDMASAVAQISEFVEEYIPKKLNTSIEMEKLIVKKTVSEFTSAEGDILPSLYYPLAHNIYKNLEKIGLSTIVKQVLVAPTRKRYWSSTYYCLPYWCSQVMAQRGVDVTIARFEKKEIYHNWSLYEKMHAIQPVMRDILKTSYWKDLEEIVNELEHRNVSMHSADAKLGRTAAIVRNKTPAGDQCFYYSTTEEFKLEDDDFSGVSYFQYYNNNDKFWTDDNTCYHVFFFL